MNVKDYEYIVEMPGRKACPRQLTDCASLRVP